MGLFSVLLEEAVVVPLLFFWAEEAVVAYLLFCWLASLMVV